MTRTLLILNHSALLMFASMYFGTGWSAILFTFPAARQATVDNYFLLFLPQVEAATRVFTVLTTLMIAGGVVMLIAEWGSDLVWVPIVLLALVVTSTIWTVRLILPINKRFRDGVSQPDVLAMLIRRWMTLHSIRVVFWTAEWVSLATFFAVRAR